MALTLVLTYVILSYVFMGVVIRVNSPIKADSQFMRAFIEDDRLFSFTISPVTIACMIVLVVFKLYVYALSRVLLKNPRPLDLSDLFKS